VDGYASLGAGSMKQAQCGQSEAGGEFSSISVISTGGAGDGRRKAEEEQSAI